DGSDITTCPAASASRLPSASVAPCSTTTSPLAMLGSAWAPSRRSRTPSRGSWRISRGSRAAPRAYSAPAAFARPCVDRRARGLSAQSQRLPIRRGQKKAPGAVEHSILYACWHMLSTASGFAIFGFVLSLSTTATGGALADVAYHAPTLPLLVVTALASPFDSTHREELQ